MGFSASWAAVRGKPSDLVLATLGLKRTGEFEEIPESQITGIALPGDWYLIFANDFSFFDRSPLMTLSADAEVVMCAVEEHVMVSSASGFAAGRESWSIVHDSQKGMNDLCATGHLPAQYEEIRAGLAAKQLAAGGEKSNVDYIFDVPVTVAEELTGFRHDGWIDGAKYERLTE